MSEKQQENADLSEGIRLDGLGRERKRNLPWRRKSSDEVLDDSSSDTGVTGEDSNER